MFKNILRKIVAEVLSKGAGSLAGTRTNIEHRISAHFDEAKTRIKDHLETEGTRLSEELRHTHYESSLVRRNADRITDFINNLAL